MFTSIAFTPSPPAGPSVDPSVLRTGQSRHLDGLLALTRDAVFQGDDLVAMVRVITETCSDTLGVERVSWWKFDRNREILVCVDLFEASTSLHHSGSKLQMADFPKYSSAVQQSDVIAAHDAALDKRTAEFLEPYLKPNNICSMLDATVRVDGQVSGVLCHEKIGTMRVWSHEDQSFAIAAAQLLGRAAAEWRRRQAEQELRLSEDRYRSLFTYSPLPSYIFDLGTLQFLAVSDSMIARYGYSREEFLAMTILQIRPAVNAEAARSSVLRLGTQERTLERWVHLTKNGAEMQMDVSARRIIYDGKRAGLAVAVEVTEQLMILDALRHSEERFREMASHIEEMFWLWEPTGRTFLYTSPGSLRIWGIDPKHFSGSDATWRNSIHPDDRQRILSARDALHSEATCAEYRIYHADGRVRWVRERSFPVLSGNVVIRVAGVVEDISERRTIEEHFLPAQRFESLG